ncbi:MAG: hypothetical protein OHK0026_08250 [Rhodocyclaceae bacterium]
MRRAETILAALLCVPALAQEIPPFTSAEQTLRVGEDESRIWWESREFDRALRNRGHLLGDAALDGYLQEIAESLYPEFRGIVRLRAVRDPQLNAFALPNGSLYIHIGLIGRADNEAQLATVIAHEAAHFVHRHGLRQRRSLKGSAAAASIAGLAGGIGGLLGQLAAISSVYGYSRDLEREADRQGFERLNAAGYSVAEGVKIFETLETEAKLLEIKEPYMFSSHPRMRERIESFRELSAKASSDGRTETARFLERAAPARIAWLEAELAWGRHKSLIHQLGREGAAERFPSWFEYYRGEALVLRGEAGDAQSAEAAFRRAIAAAPQFAPSYRSLGVLLMKRSDHGAAKAMLMRYLELAPDAADTAYVRGYLERIEAALREPGS